MIDTERLNEIFIDSLFKEGEPTEPHVLAEGVLSRYGLHPDRLKSHAEEVQEMLTVLPDEFRKTSGGGMSFLSACMDRDGNHWAEHPTIEQLFVLAIGLGKGKWLMPRELWSALPGGMPYFVIESL